MTFKSKGIVVLKRPFPLEMGTGRKLFWAEPRITLVTLKRLNGGGVEGLYYRSCQKVIML